MKTWLTHGRNVTAILLAGVCLAPAIGCGKAARRVEVLQLEDVPAPLLQIAREKLPGVTFDTVWRKPNGTFEIRGKAKNGKIREVDIRADGTVEEVE